MGREYIFADNPVLGMAVDRLDDLTWRTANLVAEIPYTAIRSIVKSGVAVAGRPVTETELIYSTFKACETMTHSTGHVLGKSDIRAYAMALGIIRPETMPSPDCWTALLSLWDFDRRLAVVCCNHQLIHEGRGLFLPSVRRLSILDEARASNDRDLFDYGCVSREPGGLTLKEMEDAR